MKTGFVLEGGAMRSMYSAGVLDIFMDNNIVPDGMIGVSAGAITGINYLSGQKGRSIRISKRFNQDKNYMGILPLLREGNIINTRYAYEILPHKLDVFDDETFQKAAERIPFYVVVTDIMTGKPRYARIRSVFRQMDIIRASASMPVVSKAVEIGEGRYLDGAITDSIPYKWLAGNGYEKLIVILTRDISYRKKPMPPALIRARYFKYPELRKQIMQRHTLYNNEIDELKELEEDGRAFVIRPSQPIEIGRLERDPSRLQEVYELGLNDGAAIMNSLKAYLDF